MTLPRRYLNKRKSANAIAVMNPTNTAAFMTLPFNLSNAESLSYALNRSREAFRQSASARAVVSLARVRFANTPASIKPFARSRASASSRSSVAWIVRSKPSTHRFRVHRGHDAPARHLLRRVVSKQRHQPHAQCHGDGHRDDDGTDGARDHPFRRAIEDLARARAFAGLRRHDAPRGDASARTRARMAGLRFRARGDS